MKLRIRGDSVRFRLQQGEVSALLARGHVEEHLRLGLRPEERITYRVELSDDAQNLMATWSGGRLAVLLPRDAARAWAAGDELTLEGRQVLGGADTLHILVEKDLACVRPRTGEDDGDAYPNPADHC